MTTCNDCPGLCCRHVGTPPGCYPAYSNPDHDGKWLTEDNDWTYWQAMPESLRAELRDYYRRALDERSIPDRSASACPCLWLDNAGRCRHYEFRPTACREAVVPGDESCLEFRATAHNRIPLDLA